MRRRFPPAPPTRTASVDLRSTTLPNGMRVISERVPYAMSVAVGIWINAGSRHDTISGTAHCLEHMVFCRSAMHTEAQRSRLLDGIGAYANATTSKDYTCYFARGLAEHFSRLANLLVELVFAPAFTERDLERERRIIVEEIRSYLESPDEYIDETLDATLFGTHPLARPIAGTLESIQHITYADVVAFHRQHYRASAATVIVAGPLSHEQVVEQIEQAVTRWHSNATMETRGSTQKAPRPRTAKRQVLYVHAQQAHIAWGVYRRLPSRRERLELALLSMLLGESASSRLARRVREQNALAYAISSSLQEWSDGATLALYAATSMEHLKRTEEALRREIACLRREPPTQAELRRAKEQLNAELLLGAESTLDRIHMLAHLALVGREVEPVHETLAAFDHISIEDLCDLAWQLGQPDLWSSVVLMPKV